MFVTPYGKGLHNTDTEDQHMRNRRQLLKLSEMQSTTFIGGETMFKSRQYALPILLLTSMVIFGCPDKKTAETEKGAIEKWTEETGKEAADQLQRPIDKAREAQDQMDSRSDDMRDSLTSSLRHWQISQSLRSREGKSRSWKTIGWTERTT